MESDPNSMSAKKVLRKRMKSLLLSLAGDEKRRQSEIVVGKLLQLPAYNSAKRISLYLNMPDEVETLPLLRHALDSGKACYIPKYYKAGGMEMVRIKDWADYLSLPVTSWNIKQPADEDIREDALHTGGLDLIVIPGLAFSLSGGRCGRGKGYYDTFLAKCKKGQAVPPVTVALSYREQVVEQVPMDAHDVPIDHVLTA